MTVHRSPKVRRTGATCQNRGADAARCSSSIPAHTCVWRLAVFLVTLFAFSWQSYVTQTHLHFHSGANPTTFVAGNDGTVQLDVGRSSSDLPADCPICQEIAHAGHYLPSVPLVFQAPESVAVWLAILLPLKPASRQRSHAWQSRAPPRQFKT